MIVVVHIALFGLLTLAVWTMRRAFEWLLSRSGKSALPQTAAPPGDETPRRAA